MVLAVIYLVLNMVIATQYAVTRIGYSYTLVHPCDASIRFIGSDNSSDGIRVLRITDLDNNDTNIQLTLRLGDVYSANMKKTFSAAFAIVNEENYDLNITHINVSSANYTYMKIWLHGNRTADAENASLDPSAVLMWDNDTIVNESNTTAWTLKAGDGNTSNMCANTSDSDTYNITTSWDETAHVRYSLNNTFVNTSVGDYVWVQITIDIPETIQDTGSHTGTIWIHLESEASD